MRSIRTFLSVLCLAAMASLATAPPANAQTALVLYGGPNGSKVSVRDATPLPVLAQPFALPASRFNYAGATGGITNTTAVALNAAVVGQRNYLAAIQYFNSAAVASEIEVRDGAVVIWRGFVPASMTTPVQVTFPVPLRGTVNTALNVALATTATATRVSAQGYTSPN